MENFNQQQQEELSRRINAVAEQGRMSEDELRRRIKWLKAEMKESQLRERVINLETNLRILLIVGLAVWVATIIIN